MDSMVWDNWSLSNGKYAFPIVNKGFLSMHWTEWLINTLFCMQNWHELAGLLWAYPE